MYHQQKNQNIRFSQDHFGSMQPSLVSYKQINKDKCAGQSNTIVDDNSSDSRYSYNLKSCLYDLTVFRVLLISLCLILIHIVGTLISVFVLVKRLLEPDMPEKSVYHICTTAFFCPLYHSFVGLTGISIQLSGSVCGLCLNLLLFMGALMRVAWALLLWLLCYTLAICGCIVLFGLILNILLIRDKLEGDVHSSTMLISVVPLLMSVLYTVCWVFVLKLWQRFKRRERQIFTIVD